MSSKPNPADLSHAMLVAILMHHGGSMEIPAGAFEPDALGGPDGSWHAVAWEPLKEGKGVRISVHPRPPVDEGGMTIY